MELSRSGFQVKLAAALLAAAAGTLLHASPAQANTVLQIRCSTDSLTPDQARARLEWARDCGTRLNVISPTTPVAPASSYDTGILAADGVSHLIEYIETDDFWGRNSYSGDAAEVNGAYSHYQWRTGVCSVANDANGFQKWTEPATLLLPRPNYPTFGNNSQINTAVQLFPNPNPALHDCNMYLDNHAGVRADVSVTGFFVNGYCTSSCYTPEQQIDFGSEKSTILDALNSVKQGLTTLTEASTLRNIKFTTDGVASYTRELHDSEHPIFVIKTKSGGELRVTGNHPVLEGNGRIVQAQSLRAGKMLIKADGARDAIVSVTKTTHFGKVYNLKPNSTNRVENILVAQGFLVGSSRFQNEDVDFMNRIILGRGFPVDVIPQ
jgi:hypothetical protein